MKTIRTIAILALCMGMLFGTTSCIVLTKKDNGKHNGWYKKPNNTQHHNNSKPEKSNEKSEKSNEKHKK